MVRTCFAVVRGTTRLRTMPLRTHLLAAQRPDGCRRRLHESRQAQPVRGLHHVATRQAALPRDDGLRVG